MRRLVDVDKHVVQTRAWPRVSASELAARPRPVNGRVRTPLQRTMPSRGFSRDPRAATDWTPRGGAGVMRWLTHCGGARVTIGIGLALVALGEGRLGVAVLLANAGSHIVVQLLKRAVARPRPCDATGRPLALVDLPDPHSFPSGHAAAATAVAATVALAHPLTAPVVLPLAGAVAYSRVTLRVHHLSDVLAGVALGLGGAVAATALLH